MFCKNCGKEVKTGNMFCEYCGERVGEEVAENVAGGHQKQKVNLTVRNVMSAGWSLLLGLIIAFTPLCLGIWYFFG